MLLYLCLLDVLFRFWREKGLFCSWNYRNFLLLNIRLIWDIQCIFRTMSRVSVSITSDHCFSWVCKLLLLSHNLSSTQRSETSGRIIRFNCVLVYILHRGDLVNLGNSPWCDMRRGTNFWLLYNGLHLSDLGRNLHWRTILLWSLGTTSFRGEIYFLSRIVLAISFEFCVQLYEIRS